jgi:hypothetical protein
MGSITQDIRILQKDGKAVSDSATVIKDLKSLECEVLVKGEANEEAYRIAINRFNQA